ncbi:hypothetical protein [Paenibacillus woosongensis]|uniref:Uncharacterized protein n=1 Tax=Paenibacillus woosongensis TaxID=307580 RepID=A0ABQ4MNI7_9BACL|nr:hypothetical protein [Paenibacillus woosongensis]GIP57559.1 hypothetical protein J15TS10_13730 [Paenibacillus woosongensis]
MASNTEHLNLLKKDPVADGNEYFNIETMLNENWDKIDEAVGNVQNRLNRSSTEFVTLQPGLQTINAKRDARFKLAEVRGRTLINILGSWGGCESLNPRYFYNRVTASIDTTVKKSGSASLKVVADTSTDTTHYYRFAGSVVEDCYRVSEGEYILFGAWIKPQSAGAHMTLFFWNETGTDNVSGLIGGSVIYGNPSKFTYGYVKAKVPPGARYVVPRIALVDQNGNENFTGTGAEGCNIDEVSIYKLSEAEYAALDGMTSEEIADKYPFVSSGIVGVENPYAIATSGNLLPPFYEWTWGTSYTVTVDGPYAATLIRTAAGQNIYKDIAAIPGDYYSLYWESDSSVQATVSIQFYDSSGNAVSGYGVNGTTARTLTVQAPQNVGTIRIVFSGDIGTILFKNPVLIHGNNPKPFKPQHKSMLTFQTEIHANPLDGSDPDVLYERNGQYNKLAKWKKVLVTGDLPEVVYEAPISYTGYKRIRLRNIGPTPQTVPRYTAFATKYNGNQLVRMDQSSGADTYAVGSDSGNYLLFHVSNADSGWGDNYTPSADEIKAFFRGWRMAANDNWGLPYPGTGVKAWGQIDKAGNLVEGSGTTTLPTVMNDQGYTPYQLLYRLAKETVEPVVSEGCLALAEGDNMVEFGTGMVLRESVKPKLDGTGCWIAIDGTKIPSSASELRYKNNVVLGVYKNSMADFKWSIVDSVNAYGRQRAYLPTADYDQSAAYSVTYLKLDKSPIVPISGSLATNEKSQLNDLTAGVSEALHRVSVVEQKKAEKDAPGWITPTLLNGWTLSSSGVFPAQYFKDSMGIVHVKGIVTGGATETVVFKLPIGYRPKITSRIPSIIMSGVNVYIAYFDVKANGDILAVFPSQSTHLTLSMSFVAEQ